MFRVSLANAFAKRTLRPLLEKHQATPLSVNLGSAVTQTVYSGMVADLDTDGTVKIATNASTNPWGLFALDYNTVINDLDGQPSDLKPFAVWQGGPDAYFRIDTPAFETDSQTYAAGTPLFVSNNGKLCASTAGAVTAGTVSVGEVVEVVSSTRLVVRVTVPTVTDVT